MLVDHPVWGSHGSARLQQLNTDAAVVGTATERAQAVDTLLQDIDALARLSLAFKEHLNRFAPVSRLSPEILLRIFHLGVEEWKPDGYGLGWLCLTHVCRFWRGLFLNERTIWANNVGIIPRAIEVFLERSGSNIPIHLDMAQRSFSQSARFGEFFRTLPLHRVHTWHQTLYDQGQINTFHEPFCRNLLPDLRELTTKRSEYKDSLVTLLTPDQIPHGNAPALTSWTSEGVFLNIIAPSLTRLRLSVSVSATKLLRFLSKCPLLEHFAGADLWIRPDDRSVPSTSRVSLNRLGEFSIYQQENLLKMNILARDLYQWFIAHVNHPASTDVAVATVRNLQSTSDLELLEFYLQMSPPSTRWKAMLTLKRTHGMISFHATSSTSPIQHGARKIDLRFLNIESLVRILHDRSQSLSIQLGRIDKLAFHEDIYDRLQPYDSLVVAAFFGVLNGTRSIHVGCAKESLMTSAVALNRHTNIGYPFPSLRRIRLEHEAMSSKNQEFPSTQILVAWLEPRIKAGVGPLSLRLVYTKGQDRNVSVDPELLALVPDVRYVEWNDPDSDDEHV